jgi:hypothetical protein
VLLTEHGYAPEYVQDETSGRFCVQFLPIGNTSEGLAILKWWQERCLEWCFARFEDGKFGDQKYLDDWPERWGTSVVVLDDVHLTLAPWNAGHVFEHGRTLGIYHFHNLRLYKGGLTKLWHSYLVPKGVGRKIYGPYLSRLRDAMRSLREIDAPPNLPEGPKGIVEYLRRKRRSWRRTEGWARV